VLDGATVARALGELEGVLNQQLPAMLMKTAFVPECSREMEVAVSMPVTLK
jgi:hypothetical protein